MQSLISLSPCITLVAFVRIIIFCDQCTLYVHVLLIFTESDWEAEGNTGVYEKVSHTLL